MSKIKEWLSDLFQIDVPISSAVEPAGKSEIDQLARLRDEATKAHEAKLRAIKAAWQDEDSIKLKRVRFVYLNGSQWHAFVTAGEWELYISAPLYKGVDFIRFAAYDDSGALSEGCILRCDCISQATLSPGNYVILGNEIAFVPENNPIDTTL